MSGRTLRQPGEAEHTREIDGALRRLEPSLRRLLAHEGRARAVIRGEEEFEWGARQQRVLEDGARWV